MPRFSFSPGSCAVLCVAFALTPALAQDDRPESWTADEIVVTGQRLDSYAESEAATATKTPTPIEAVPQSIQVLSNTLLEEQDRRTLFDALENIAGVTPIRNEELVLADPIVRGFAAEIYVDGLPAFGSTAVISPGTLIAVQRVEVAKGPTATLYGGGAGAPLGGLINLVSKTPGRAAGYRFGARGGSFDTESAFVDLDRPLGEAAGVRIVAEYEDRGSWIDAVGTESIQVSPSAALRFGPDTRLTVVGHYNRVEQLEYAGLPAALIGVPEVDPETFSGAIDAPETVVENTLVTAALDHRFGESVSAAITGRYYDSRFREFASFPFLSFFPPTGTRYPIIKGVLPTDVKQISLDATLLWRFETGALQHQLLLGANYDDTDYDAAVGFAFTPIGVLDYANPVPPPFGAIPPVTGTQTDRFETIAFYAQDQIDIGARLHLLGSARYTRLDFRRAETGFDARFERVTPRVGATYALGGGIALFAGYAEGFRAPTGFFGRADPVPETSRAFEGGLKLADRGSGLSGTLAMYRITRRNVPTADPAAPFNTVQTGEQRAQGFEADLVWEPSPALSVLASHAYTEAEVTEDNSIPEGDRLTRVPRHAGRVAARYRFLEGGLTGLEIGAGVTALSGRELTLPNTLSVEGRFAADLQASYDFGPATIALSVANLTGEDDFDAYSYLGQAVVIPVQPRSAFVSLRAGF